MFFGIEDVSHFMAGLVNDKKTDLELFIESLENDIKSQESQNVFCNTSESIKVKKRVLKKAKKFLKK